MNKLIWWHLIDRAYKMMEASGYRITEHDPEQNDPIAAWMSDARTMLQAVPEPEITPDPLTLKNYPFLAHLWRASSEGEAMSESDVVADAMRYRWLRAQKDGDSSIAIYFYSVKYVNAGRMTDAEVDAAIDAERAERP